MHSQQHPDTEQLDRLRAGLLDDRPDEKSLLQDHLAHCDVCQSHLGSWEQLGPGSLGAELETAALRRDLRAARLRALDSSSTSRHSHALAPYATAALLLVAVLVGIWTGQNWLQTQPQVTVQAAHEVPDIYEDLDFYLWLANQKDAESDSHTDNPNNT